MLILYGFVALCTFARISADDICGPLKSMENFNKSLHMGTWYLSRAVNNYDGVLCEVYNLFDGPSEKIHMNVSRSFPRGTPDGQITSRHRITYEKPMKPSSAHRTREIPEIIVGTDYTSFSVLFDCGVGEEETELYILTRKPHPPQSVIEAALGVARERGFNLTDMVESSEHCWEKDVPSNQDNNTKTKP